MQGFPEHFENSDPPTPIASLQRLSLHSDEISDFPFSQGELVATARRYRRFPDSYYNELVEWRRKAREFAFQIVRPAVRDIEARVAEDPTYFDHSLMRQACHYGLLSAVIPRELGGGGARSLHMATVVEELATACAGVASTIGVQSAGISCAMLSLSPTILRTFVQPIAVASRRGEPVLWGAAITEPAAGTDIWDAQFLARSRAATFAKRVEGGYRLTGRKCFVSSGHVATFICVAAAVDPRDIAGSWSLFLVPTSSPGFSIGRIERKMGQKASPVAEVTLDDVFVPEAQRIGAEGACARMVKIMLAGTRGPVGAIGVGCARRALESFVIWARERALIDQQWIQMRIAEMARRIFLARQAYAAASLVTDEIMADVLDGTLIRLGIMAVDASPLPIARALSRTPIAKQLETLLNHAATDERLAQASTLATIAKITGSDTGVAVAGEVMRIMGEDAYEARFAVDRCYRDAKLTQIYEGTNQANAITQWKGMVATWSDARV